MNWTRNQHGSTLWVAVAIAALSGMATRADDAADFALRTEEVLGRLAHQNAAAAWEAHTNETPENGRRSIDVGKALDGEIARRAQQARQFAAQDPITKRKLFVLTLNSAGIPKDPAVHERLLQLRGRMASHYADACPVVDAGRPCVPREQIEAQLAKTRDAARLRTLWMAWYDTAKPIKGAYAEFTELANQGARDTGYADASIMSRAIYEVVPDEFLREMEALWTDLRPLYLLLHAYVRDKLVAKYGTAEVDPRGPIPIHLVGNLWGQDWESIIDLLDAGDTADFDATVAPLPATRFIEIAERFFVSVGFPSLPKTFWERSYFERPRGNFDCHPSAWRIGPDDWRLKMCVVPNWYHFVMAHHEIGHVFYFQSFAAQPFFFRDPPNAGINEAIGDVAQLSVTPDYLRRIGLLRKDGWSDINHLMRAALRKLVRVQFGLMLQKWRWGVQSGSIKTDQYNDAWWALVREYQGLAPPAPRPADAFDPGAKQHIAADIDYIRYFLADVLTFQIHAALSREAGCLEPIHRCSIYESRDAGKRWRAALQLGSSRPWGDVLEVMTGDRRISGQPMRSYLAPLETWLKSNTQGKPIGWQ